MKILNIVGARPNFMKIAPIMEAYKAVPDIEPVLVHTGQHYDERMSDLFFRQLGIPEPDINLEVGSGTHATQTAAIMVAFEKLLNEQGADAVLVVGDVNSTIACGMVSVKMGIPLVHVEAGLRSGDRGMPEEINRILTDSISDLLFCTEQSGIDNLRREGLAEEKVHLVGNVMIDTLLKNRDQAEASTILGDLGLEPKGFAVLTLHRPSNVDDEGTARRLLAAVDRIQGDMPVIFPIHPRSRKNFERHGFGDWIGGMGNLRLVEPLGYLEFLKLLAHARVVLTDSGGIQEETTILGTPCLTLRENTERPVTVEVGSNRLVGTRTETILGAYSEVMAGEGPACGVPPLWDGRAAERIVKVMARTFVETAASLRV